MRPLPLVEPLRALSCPRKLPGNPLRGRGLATAREPLDQDKPGPHVGVRATITIILDASRLRKTAIDVTGAWLGVSFERLPRARPSRYMLPDGPRFARGRRNTMAIDVERARRLFTVEEYHRMAEVGILKPTDRVELIRGEIVQMSPPGRRHIAFVDNLNQLLVVRLAGRAIVSVQNPVIIADDSEPQPDLSVLRRRPTPYKDAQATSMDVLLLIEVAETSLRYDRTAKLRLYAEAGVPEYWVVDCAAETVEIHRGPAGTAGYRDVVLARGGGTLTLQAFPNVALTVDEIFA
jgi:Uma2 family endonuclease